jgi:hypothetical protein
MVSEWVKLKAQRWLFVGDTEGGASWAQTRMERDYMKGLRGDSRCESLGPGEGAGDSCRKIRNRRNGGWNV